jgi:hypothetical protein
VGDPERVIIPSPRSQSLGYQTDEQKAAHLHLIIVQSLKSKQTHSLFVLTLVHAAVELT